MPETALLGLSRLYKIGALNWAADSEPVIVEVSSAVCEMQSVVNNIVAVGLRAGEVPIDCGNELDLKAETQSLGFC
jgi:hypothetical protein